MRTLDRSPSVGVSAMARCGYPVTSTLFGVKLWMWLNSEKSSNCKLFPVSALSVNPSIHLNQHNPFLAP